ARIGDWVAHHFGAELEALRDLTAPEPDPDLDIAPRADATRPMRRPPRVIGPPPRAPEEQHRAPAPRSRWLLLALVLVVSLMIGAAAAYCGAVAISSHRGASDHRMQPTRRVATTI